MSLRRRFVTAFRDRATRNMRSLGRNFIWHCYCNIKPGRGHLCSTFIHSYINCSESEEADMETPASIAKHPIHPMLVALPIGLWVFSLVSDIIYRAGWGSAVWNDVAFYTLAGGIVGALL